MSTAKEKHVSLAGSHRQRLHNAQITGEVPQGEFQVTVMVRRQKALPAAATAKAKLHERSYISRQELAATYGAAKSDLDKVTAFAQAHHLRVVEADAAKRHVILSGTTQNYNQAFGVDLKMYKAAETTYRGREGDIKIPESLHGVVTSVTGLDNRPFAKPHFRIRRGGSAKAVSAGAHTAAPHAAAAPVPAGFSPVQLAQLYNFPATTGAGQTIAILELGGGFHATELTTYFQNLGIQPPKVTAASYTGGGKNNPGTDPFLQTNPDVEVALDIEVAGAVAPGANIVVYFAPDASDQSFLGAINAIVHDTTNNPNVVSISWGGPEDTASGQFQTEFDQVLQAAAQIGMTVCVAAGDSGSADFASDDPNWDGKAHVDFPAASSNVLACGGTFLTASGTAIASEVVWHDGPNDGTGGGVSRVFPQPSYQASVEQQAAVDPAGPVMRGVPDVCGDAAPGSGYQVLCDGQSFPDAAQGVPPVGGTSAVAPLWAGLTARLNQALGKPVGFLNPLIYAIPSSANAFNDITSGNNGDYSAGPGWDACTGLGSPNGQNLLVALGGASVASGGSTGGSSGGSAGGSSGGTSSPPAQGGSPSPTTGGKHSHKPVHHKKKD
jgi:kumamolisin